MTPRSFGGSACAAPVPAPTAACAAARSPPTSGTPGIWWSRSARHVEHARVRACDALRGQEASRRLQHLAAFVLDQMHVVDGGGEPHAHAFARAGLGTDAAAHVDAVDA